MKTRESLSTVVLMMSFRSILCVLVFVAISAVEGAIEFTLPKDLEIVCSDSLDNVCTAPVAW